MHTAPICSRRSASFPSKPSAITPCPSSGTPGPLNEPRPGPDYAAAIAPYYFNLRKASIYAGSNEIQRNIMAKAVLGL